MGPNYISLNNFSIKTSYNPYNNYDKMINYYYKIKKLQLCINWFKSLKLTTS